MNTQVAYQPYLRRIILPEIKISSENRLCEQEKGILQSFFFILLLYLIEFHLLISYSGHLAPNWEKLVWDLKLQRFPPYFYIVILYLPFPLPSLPFHSRKFSQCLQMDIDGGMELVWKMMIRLLKLSLGILAILLIDLKQVKQSGFFFKL